jgi:hypothetical protein
MVTTYLDENKTNEMQGLPPTDPTLLEKSRGTGQPAPVKDATGQTLGYDWSQALYKEPGLKEFDYEIHTPSGHKILPDGSYQLNTGEIKTPEEFNNDPILLEAYKGDMSDAINKSLDWAKDNSDEFTWLISKVGDRPETRAFLSKLMPDWDKTKLDTFFNSINPKSNQQQAQIKETIGMHAVSDAELGQKLQPDIEYPLDRPPTKWEELINHFTPWKQGIDTPENWAKRKIAETLSDEYIPNKVKNLGLYILETLGDTSFGQVAKMFDSIVGIWDTVSTLWVKEPYALWKSPTLVYTAGVFGKENYDVTVKGLINQVPYLIGPAEVKGVQKLIEYTAGRILKGEAKEVIAKTVASEASKLGVSAEEVLSDANKLSKEAVKNAVAPSEIKLPPKLADLTPGETYNSEKMITLEDGTVKKIVEPDYVELKQGDVIQDPAKVYVDPQTQKPYVPKEESVQTPPTNAPSEAGKAQQGVSEAKAGESGAVPLKPVEPVNPVGEGDVKASRLYERLKEGYKEQLGLDEVTYGKMGLEANTERAIKFVNDNPVDAEKILRGMMKPPDDVTGVGISLATALKHLDEGDLIGFQSGVAMASRYATRYGQEIVSIRGFVTDNSPAYWIREVQSAKMSNISRAEKSVKGTPKEKASKIIDKEVKKIKDILTDKTTSIERLQSVLDGLVC